MKTIALCLALVSLCGTAIAGSTRRGPVAARPARPQPAVDAPARQLPISRVTIYSNGVAYVERRGTVSGHAEVSLPFKQSQIDDALKSMVVLDLGKGTIGAVSYASSEPASARLSQIPLRIGASSTSNDSLGGLAGVLGQLQGARVTVAAGARAVTGAVLTVEQRTAQIEDGKPPVTTRALTVVTDDGGVETFDLADVRSVRLVDDTARRDLAEFASASAAARRRDSNTIVVTTDGTGARELVVGYTVAAPIWKTSYRVVLDDSGKPFFQGWAIVDNVSEDDWTNVSLSLVSGAPVSFIQNLQQPYYRYRPVIPVPAGVQLTPQLHEGAMGDEVSEVANEEETVATGESQSAMRRAQSLPLNGRAAGATELSQRGYSPMQNALTTVTAADAPAPGPSLGEDTGVTAAASGEEVGDLFEYRVENPVTLARNRSALIPIVQTRLEGARVSVYNESVRRDRPLGALRLKNTTNLTFEAGPMTIFEGDSYVGEAIVDRLKPGEERFISFDLDQGTLVTPEAGASNGPVFQVVASKGVMWAKFYRVETKTYTIKNQTDRRRVLYIEHPRRANWKFIDETLKPAETTQSLHRFRIELDPRETEKLVVAERSEQYNTFRLSELDRDTVAVFVSRRYIDDATKARLEAIVALRERVAAIDKQIEASEAEATEIKTDQERLRANVAALGDTAAAKALIVRYVAKADQQETQLEKLAADRKAAQAERLRVEQQLEAAVQELAFDQPVQ